MQEWIGHISITAIKGSYYNVMGLPVQSLYEELCKFVVRNDASASIPLMALTFSCMVNMECCKLGIFYEIVYFCNLNY